jgi:hypothetical protein
MSTLHHDPIFAPIDIDLHLERIGGGNETEVYCTDERRYVVKVKSDHIGTVHEMVAQGRHLRRAARRFSTVMGTRHTIPNAFLIAANAQGQAQLLALQPFRKDARPLSSINYAQLTFRERRTLAGELLHIMRRAMGAYWKRGWMPDLYGRSSRSSAERARLNHWYLLPWRLWSFVVQRNLLRANNLMLTTQPDQRLILVDYDPVMRSKLYQRVYYALRVTLFLRDICLIALMIATGWVPPAQ